MSSQRTENDAAFRSAKHDLEKRFQTGHFVAFDQGKLIADAHSFEALSKLLDALGKAHPDVFVAQVGIDFPDEVFILLDR